AGPSKSIPGFLPASGLTTPSARARLRCYACSFARPCYPVPTECQDDEACGISVGTSGRTLTRWPLSCRSLCPSSLASCPTFLLCPTDQNEVIERKGCLPRAQCPLPGHATYWSRSYMLRHQCCEQDLCNLATSTRQLPSLLLTTLVLLVTGFTWGGRLLH
uniref:Sperm acrosome membrane-associated protein 4-like n=1 Tax=Chinchilla lanigera TaxID=34839 RepID=A0A8C2V8N2_CHILA